MLKYLNIEQMTADIRQFLIHASVVGFVPKQAPWVLIGGSFAGSLMAWTKYQHTIDALVIASSAPMRIVDGFWEFDNMVIKRLPCASQLSSTIRLVDAVLDNKNATNAKQLTHQFGFNSAEDLEQFSTSLVAQVSQLMLESVGSQVLEQIAEFCNYFGKANSIETQTNTIRDNFNHHQSASFGRDKCPQGDELSWFWLQCTELGLWQTAPPVGSNMFGHRLRSRRLSVEYFEIQCKRCLPDSWNILKGQWKQGFRAFSQEAFTRYKSRDLFTVGDLDPWSALAMENTQGHDGAEVLVIKGAAHAEDLRLSEDIDESEENDALGALAVVDARRHIVGMIKKWSADFGNMHMQRTSDAGTSKSTCVVRSFAMVLTLMFVLVM
ncbi:hypothetical protein COEREDRAFT_88045 [Coemansia reversa NRRL 1564]|uniref:Peptidase S28 n=1 Tax=Coemansia reversa (strain ATCC 12441 / NRRL 1564) TaxID=763665 RepID=A0A2G5B842_COERN|nr:hypothetical protein COEREDRAFT_88045 [Coemansia reversa NRRL 1564]|eukprot:PIA15188.1 hypothetical protein COEREDRAFT_88045 [Coemansia reversa NRRL 1564]